MLTKKQKLVLDFITTHTQANGYAPTLQEVQSHLGAASVSTAHFFINQLKLKGYLKKIPNQARAISITTTPLTTNDSDHPTNKLINKQTNQLINQPTNYLTPNQILYGDALTLLDNVTPDSIHLVLSDIPYGINLDSWDIIQNSAQNSLLGSSPAQLGKNAFKRRGKPLNGWSESDRNLPKEYQEWCTIWAKKLFPLVKQGGSIFIFSARRTLHRALIALEDSGFILRDILAWEKPAAHNRAHAISKIFKNRGLEKEAAEWSGWRLGNLSPKYEPIAWLFKPYESTITDNVLKHQVGAINIDDCSINGKFPSNILKFDFSKNETGLHEAQKPLALIEYLIKLTTTKNQTILDPFIGSGTTALAAKNLERNYIGFEILKKYHNIATKRLKK